MRWHRIVVLVLVLVLCAWRCRAMRLDEGLAQVDLIIPSIISQFFGYDLIFHYDEQTQARIDVIIERATITGAYLMINYDAAGAISERPTGYRFLHVVLLQNYTRFELFTGASPFSLEYVDVLLFVVNLGEDGAAAHRNYTLWRGNVLDRAGGLFVLDSWGLSLYTICFFCGELSERPRKIDELSMSDDGGADLPALGAYINKFNDFNGHLFRVGYTMYRPYFWCTILSSNKSNVLFDVFGPEGELLALLNEQLHLSYFMVEFKNEVDLWDAMIEAVHNKSLDWAVGGITLSMERMKLVDFTSSIRAEAFTILYSVYEDPWMSWEYILIPFEMVIWLILFIAVFVLSGLFYITVKATKADGTMSFFDFTQGCWRFLVEQPLPEVPRLLKTRWTTMILTFLWLTVALIMTNAYKSKLTSAVISSRAERLDSIDQLVEKDFRFQISNEDSTVLEENLRSSNDPKFLETLHRSSNDSDFCESVLKTIGCKVAVIDEETNIQFMVQENCRKLMSMEEHDDLRLISDDLFPSQHAWPLQLGAPYRTSFNDIITRLHAAGIFVKWNNDYASPVQKVPKSSQTRQSSRTQKNMTLTALAGPGFIWVVGNLAALLVFVVEKIYGR